MNKNKIYVGIIDLKINNIYSVYRSCIEAGFKTEIVNFKKKRLSYDIIILPGVGAFKTGVKFMKNNRIKDKLNVYLEKPNSLLYGVCLGMQLLFEESFEFEKTKGLEFINGKVVKFNKKDIRTTHLGWNKFEIQNNNFKNDFKKFENKYFYFIHSYYAQPKQKQDIFGTTPYGKMNFCSMAKKGNIFGTQFHPEKSGYWGIEFLKNLKKLI